VSPYEKTAVKPHEDLPKRKRTMPLPFFRQAPVTAAAQQASEAAKHRGHIGLEPRERHVALVVGLALALAVTFSLIILAIHYLH
jgi:hypothetical protein